jgi:dTDP-glucose 4,6-dehydratase
MRLLVTGGAGFIGSNFVHFWLERYPDDHLVVYDLLTYAGNRPSIVDIEDRIVFVLSSLVACVSSWRARRTGSSP